MPLIILHGNERLARREAFEKLRAKLDTDGGLATNTVTLFAAQATPQEVMAACDTVPFLSDRRLVVVEGVLSAAGKGNKRRKKGADPGADGSEDASASAWATLTGYIDRMPPSTTLVLIDDAVPSDGLLKEIGAKGDVKSFSPVTDKDLPGWVAARAKEAGLKIDFAAAKLLAELVGSGSGDSTKAAQTHMAMLATEIDKLAAYANSQPVRSDDVRELVGRAKEHKGWALSDAVIEGSGAKAAKIVEEMVADGSAMPVMLSSIAGRYRRVAIAKDMLERGESGSAIASRLGMKQNFALDKLIEQAQRYSWRALRAAYARMIEAELDMKRTDGMEERVALDLVVQDLASGPVR